MRLEWLLLRPFQRLLEGRRACLADSTYGGMVRDTVGRNDLLGGFMNAGQNHHS